MAYNSDITDELVHLAELALRGQERDVSLFLRRLAARLRKNDPAVAERLQKAMRNNKPRASLIREAQPFHESVPRDQETRAELLRIEDDPQPDVEPVFTDGIAEQLKRLLAERRMETRLIEKGLAPTRSVLFTGVPGVGKTLTARWLARELEKPLASLDLATVMNSFLGRTGWNIRQALDYAKTVPCVLLLDEFDALAKMRDDPTEVGELKRLVAVLLQEIDLWPATSLLIAATNHEKLLDPAVWRRFDLVIQFPLPDHEGVQRLLESHIEPDGAVSVPLMAACAYAMTGASYSDVQRTMRQLRMNAIVNQGTLADQMERFIENHATSLSTKDGRITFAATLREIGFSERKIHEVTGLSRDTLRKYRPAKPQKSGTRKRGNQ
ncbi:MAG: ATP-binding protein [Candidatus Lindowbacteria bacterium]|nr:ATP-binding protein [Candidatus Lindowbacteria bacterium]